MDEEELADGGDNEGVGVSAVALRFCLLITLLSSSAFLLLPRVLAASEGRVEGRVVSAGLV